ncbi:MAG TPA: hypothetical protein VMS88_01575, partial [Terriglobales bacterium]|nr:hypothetical protein [Terriglobales bacterium]
MLLGPEEAPRVPADRPGTEPAPGPRGLLVLAVLGTALRLALVVSGWCDNRVVADDAFYYFTIARNLAAGHGATFDGLAPTNGFHPLWLLLLTPVFAFARAVGAGSWSAVHMALALCAGFDLLSGILLARLLRRCGAPHGAIAAAAVWFLSPFTVLLSLRGMESALNVTLFALWAGLLPGAFARGTADGGGRGGPHLRDGLALAVVTLVAALRGRAGWGRAAGFLAVAGLTAAVGALPWFLWNLATFGTPWQVSGAA